MKSSEADNIKAHLDKLRVKRSVLKHAAHYEIKLLIAVNNKIKHIKRIYRMVKEGHLLTEREKSIWHKILQYKQRNRMKKTKIKNKRRKIKLLGKSSTRIKRPAIPCANM